MKSHTDIEKIKKKCGYCKMRNTPRWTGRKCKRHTPCVTVTKIKLYTEEQLKKEREGMELINGDKIEETWGAGIKEGRRQEREEVIKELDDIIDLWFGAHNKIGKSFMIGDFRKFISDKLHSQTNSTRLER